MRFILLLELEGQLEQGLIQSGEFWTMLQRFDALKCVVDMQRLLRHHHQPVVLLVVAAPPCSVWGAGADTRSGGCTRTLAPLSRDAQPPPDPSPMSPTGNLLQLLDDVRHPGVRCVDGGWGPAPRRAWSGEGPRLLPAAGVCPLPAVLWELYELDELAECEVGD